MMRCGNTMWANRGRQGVRNGFLAAFALGLAGCAGSQGPGVVAQPESYGAFANPTAVVITA